MTTQPEPGIGQPDHELDAVIRERRQLVNLAYRLLGSLAEAEDAVQETYARWYAQPGDQREAIESPGGWLTTVASRICLDMLGSARARHERYVGEWLPEPLPDGREQASGGPRTTRDPADQVTLDESVGMAFLVVLESMTPAQRVAFILHDVYRYSFAEVAEITGRTPDATRQLASTARRRIGDTQPPAAPHQQARIVRDFKRAWEAQSIAALIELLDPDATFTADGGGLVSAALAPIEGGSVIARYAVSLAARRGGMTFLERTVNGQPGLVAQQDGVTVTVFAFGISGDRITRIWAVRNPDKLHPWAARLSERQWTTVVRTYDPGPCQRVRRPWRAATRTARRASHRSGRQCGGRRPGWCPRAGPGSPGRAWVPPPTARWCSACRRGRRDPGPTAAQRSRVSSSAAPRWSKNVTAAADHYHPTADHAGTGPGPHARCGRCRSGRSHGCLAD
jgi:RNA polymerase sigma factor (sigma-70 family)